MTAARGSGRGPAYVLALKILAEKTALTMHQHALQHSNQPVQISCNATDISHCAQRMLAWSSATGITYIATKAADNVHQSMQQTNGPHPLYTELAPHL